MQGLLSSWMCWQKIYAPWLQQSNQVSLGYERALMRFEASRPLETCFLKLIPPDKESFRLCWALRFGDCTWTSPGERNTITRHLAWSCLLLPNAGELPWSFTVSPQSRHSTTVPPFCDGCNDDEDEDEDDDDAAGAGEVCGAWPFECLTCRWKLQKQESWLSLLLEAP